MILKGAAPTRDGQSLTYRAIGSGPEVLLLHGFAMHGAMWIPSILPLTRRYRFILPDLRGFGDSRGVPYAHPNVVRNFAEDVEDLVEHLKLRSFILGGLSMGGLTSLAFAQMGGFANVQGYIHMDQSPTIDNNAHYQGGVFGSRQTEFFDRFRVLLDQVLPHEQSPFDGLPRALRESIFKNFASFFEVAVHTKGLKAVMRTLAHPSIGKHSLPLDYWQAYFHCLKAYLTEHYDFSESLSSYAGPCAFFVGETSEMYPAAEQLAFAARYQSGRTFLFRDTGHALPLEAPVRFVRELDSALRWIESMK